jgi:hypothetical protein
MAALIGSLAAIAVLAHYDEVGSFACLINLNGKKL